jgi:hypothetical protein
VKLTALLGHDQRWSSKDHAKRILRWVLGLLQGARKAIIWPITQLFAFCRLTTCDLSELVNGFKFMTDHLQDPTQFVHLHSSYTFTMLPTVSRGPHTDPVLSQDGKRTVLWKTIKKSNRKFWKDFKAQEEDNITDGSGRTWSPYVCSSASPEQADFVAASRFVQDTELSHALSILESEEGTGTRATVTSDHPGRAELLVFYQLDRGGKK